MILLNQINKKRLKNETLYFWVFWGSFKTNNCQLNKRSKMIFRDKYWTESFLKDLEFTRSLRDVALLAKSVIKTIPKPVF